jgi:hypothetical protein
MSIVFDSEANKTTGHIPIGDSGTDEICIPNISTRERRKRLAGGAIAVVMALGILVLLIASGASVWWRLVLFPLFFGAASGFFQWRDKT